MVASVKVKVLTRSIILSETFTDRWLIQRILSGFFDITMTHLRLSTLPLVHYLTHTSVDEQYPHDHLAKISNIAEHFYKIELVIIRYTIQWIRSMAVYIF